MSGLKFKFNKKWFENYWYYYKIHTFAGMFVLLIAIITLVECATNVETDATVTYMGSSAFNTEFTSSFENELSQYIDDINDDGIKKVYFSVLTLSDSVKSEQDIAIQQKAQLEIAAGETYLFLMDEKYYNTYKEQEIFLDVSKELGLNEPSYGFMVSNSTLLKKLGFNKSDSKIYAAVRVLTQGDEKKQEKVSFQNNALKILKELYKKD